MAQYEIAAGYVSTFNCHAFFEETRNKLGSLIRSDRWNLLESERNIDSSLSAKIYCSYKCPVLKIKKLLMLAHSAGFIHDYLPTARETIIELGRISGMFQTLDTEDCSLVNSKSLSEFSATLFVTSGELPMNEEQKKALMRFVKEGGAFIGVHNAADTFHKFSEYGQMLGGYFQSHPWTQEVTAVVEDQTHPATSHLPQIFGAKEEVYTFRNWSREKTHVLISLDRTSVDLSKGTRSDHDYALCWCHNYGNGRVFYTAFGHFNDLWKEEWFRKHLLNGILWAMKSTEQ